MKKIPWCLTVGENHSRSGCFFLHLPQGKPMSSFPTENKTLASDTKVRFMFYQKCFQTVFWFYKGKDLNQLFGLANVCMSG